MSFAAACGVEALLRRISLRRQSRDRRDERPVRPPGPVASMLAGDIDNIDELTRALAAKR